MNTTKVLVTTLFVTLFMMGIPIHAESELKHWEASIHTNETTKQIEKRLVYWYPNHVVATWFLLVVPCDINERVAIEVDNRNINYRYRPEWYYPRGKIKVRLDKKRLEWQAFKPEGTSSWLYVTVPSTTQLIQQLKDHNVLRLRIEQYGARDLKARFELSEFEKLYDSHCD